MRRPTMQIYERELLEHWRNRQRRFELSEIDRLSRLRRVDTGSAESKRLIASNRAPPKPSSAVLEPNGT